MKYMVPFRKIDIPEEPTVEPIEPDAVLYFCDRRACEHCSYPLCKHTRDICHAVNFEKNLGGAYWEKEKRDLYG